MLFKISAPFDTHLKELEKIVSNVAGMPMEVSPALKAVYNDPDKPDTHFIWEMQPKGGS